MSVHKLPSATGDASERVVLPFPISDTPGRPYLRLHRPVEALEIAEDVGDKEMIAAIRERLSKTVHVRLTDSRMIGPNEFEELGPPFHWSTVPLTIAGICVALIFAAQLLRGFFERLF